MQGNEFFYRLFRRARGLRPGMHAGLQRADGQEAIAHVGLLEGRDPRRLDALASARDPMRRLLIRVARQRASVTVYVLADLSASMGVDGAINKLSLLADFTDALTLSASLGGDAFAFIGYDDVILPQFLLPPGRDRGSSAELTKRLRSLRPDSSTARALGDAASWVTRRDALVFVVSDFHVDVPLLDAALGKLSRHQVIPVVLIDVAEREPHTRFGPVRVRDAESGIERTVFMRPSMRERLIEERAGHERALRACFHRHGAFPLELVNEVDADHITRHFHA